MTAPAIAGLVLTAYAVAVVLVAVELARVWWGVQRVGRRCSPHARRLARLAVGLVVCLASPVVLDLTPTRPAVLAVAVLWRIVREVRVSGVVIRSTLTRKPQL